MVLRFKQLNSFLLLVTTVGLMACNNKKPGNKIVTRDSLVAKAFKPLSGAESLQVVHDIDSIDYDYLFKRKTNIWLSKLLNNSGLTWTNFRLTDFEKRNSEVERDDTLSKKFLDDYAGILEWSPDSSYLLDLGSYNREVKKDKAGKTHLEVIDFENEIRLYDVIAKKSKRLFFNGTASSTWDGHWADSSQVALVGVSDTSNSHHPDTLLWLIDVKNNFFRTYKYSRR